MINDLIEMSKFLWNSSSVTSETILWTSRIAGIQTEDESNLKRSISNNQSFSFWQESSSKVLNFLVFTTISLLSWLSNFKLLCETNLCKSFVWNQTCYCIFRKGKRNMRNVEGMYFARQIFLWLLSRIKLIHNIFQKGKT